MCRFVCYSGEEMPVRPIVFGGSHTLVRQSFDAREMGHGVHNADGYGVGWYHEGRPVRIREARPIWHDPDLGDVLGSVRSTCSLALVRSASPGIPLDRGEVAPFVFERWSFGLNGYVRRFHTHAMRSLRATLPDELYTQIRGTSDTETLFLLAVAEVWKGASPGLALARAAERACALEVRCKLNMILADGRNLAVIRTSNFDETNTLYVAHRHPLAPGGTLIASERLDEAGEWQVVPPYSVIEVTGRSEPRITEVDALLRGRVLSSVGAGGDGRIEEASGIAEAAAGS